MSVCLRGGTGMRVSSQECTHARPANAQHYTGCAHLLCNAGTSTPEAGHPRRPRPPRDLITPTACSTSAVLDVCMGVDDEVPIPEATIPYTKNDRVCCRRAHR